MTTKKSPEKRTDSAADERKSAPSGASSPAFPSGTGERDRGGRFVAGNTISRLGGRPTAPREAALYAAAVEGAGGAEGVREVMAVVRKRALEGSAPHAALFARVLGLDREDTTTPAVELGESAAAVLRDPAKAQAIDELLDRVFDTPKPTNAAASPAGPLLTIGAKTS